MEKQDYVNILEERLWDRVDDYFGEKNNVQVSQVNHVDINPEDWIQFSIDNFDLADQNHEEPKAHYVEEMNWLSIVNNKLGRNKYNSFELNYGKRGDTNAKLIKLLGPENIDRLGIEQDCLLLRLLVNMPGNGKKKNSGTKMRRKVTPMYPSVRGLEQCTRPGSIDWCNGHAPK